MRLIGHLEFLISQVKFLIIIYDTFDKQSSSGFDRVNVLLLV